MSVAERRISAAAERPAPALVLPLWPTLGLLVAGLALWLRLGALDAIALSPREAARALEAYQLQRGTLAAYAEDPLLTNLLAGWFWLFTPADGPARLPAALAGWLLCLTPLLYRSRLGWIGAAGAAAFLALSPIGLLASRTVHPAVLVALAAAACVGCLVQAWDRADGRWLLGASGAVAVGLGAGPAFVGQLAAVVLALAAWPPFGRPPFDTRRWLPRAAGVGLLVALLADTLLLTRPGGLQAGLLEPFSLWLRRLSLDVSAPQAVALLWLHELPVLVFALIGLARERGSTTVRFLAVWAAASLALAALQQSPELATLAAPLVPLALLAGLGLKSLRGLRPLRERSVRLVALVLLVPTVFWVLGTNLALGRGSNLPYAVTLVAAGAVLATVIFASSWLSRPLLLAALALPPLLGLAVLQVTMVSRLVYAGQDRDAPLTFSTAGRQDLRLVEARAWDWWRQDPTEPIVVDQALRPHLGWYLRNGPPVRYVAASPEVAERAILGPLTATNRPSGNWLRLVVAESYQPPGRPSLPALWRWLSQRQPLGRAEPYAILISP